MKNTIITLFILVWSQCLFAEQVQTLDGRTILLNDDGTYEVLPSKISKVDGIIKTTSHYFKRHEGDYGQKSIRFMPIFENISDRKITAVRFTSSFLDPFGDVIFTFSGDSEEIIMPDKRTNPKMFYNFEDNQFINDQPYDKLLSSVVNKTGKIQTNITAVVFENGDILKF